MRELEERPTRAQVLSGLWNEQLERNVANKLRELRKDGVTDIGFECLLQHTSLIPNQ